MDKLMTQSIIPTIIEEKTASGIFARKTFTSSSRDTLILVMGYGGSLRIWPETFIEKLARKFTVITYDNRGTGHSFLPKQTEEFTIKAMADDLFEVVKMFNVESHHLLGYSMGSCIALQYAHDHQERVRSLFLLSGTAGGSLYVKPDKAMSTALANPEGKTLWDIYMYTWSLMYSPDAFERCQPAFKAIYEASKETPTRPVALIGHSHAFRGFDGTSYLADFKMPTAILAGRTDRLMPSANSENLAKHISGAKLILLDDCEHGPHIQSEDAVIEAIENCCASAT